MTKTSRYLTILAKVMRNKNLSEDGLDKEKYIRLYFLIHSELNSKLQKSIYPHTSDIIQRTEDMLDAIEPLYLCHEIVGKHCLLISSHITTNIFEVCKTLFENQELVSTFKKIYTQIPFVIVDTNEADTVEVLNYANIRITLSISELKFLIIESGRRKIALNKIIQFVIVKTKLKDSTLCIIADNIYSNAEKMFGRVISRRLVYIDKEGANTIEKRRIGTKSTLIMSDDVFASTMNNPSINKYKRILFNEIDEYVKNEVNPVLYGFWEEYTSIETQITDYYENQLSQTKSTLQEVVGDIVRIGNNDDKTLQSIRFLEEDRDKKLETEKKSIVSTLKSIDELVVEICSDLGETFITGKDISRNIIDDIFESFFRCKDFSSGLGKKLLSRLYSYEYDNYELVTAYVQSNTGATAKFESIDIDFYEWEKARMLINLLDPEKIPNRNLDIYIKALGKRYCTGKELYAKALISPENQKQEILQESLRKGYEAAGLKLLDMYKKCHSGVNLQTLANALVPEACMILANQKMTRYQNRRRFTGLTDKEFTYYKIAAANQYLPAIGKIVDIVFESRFSSGFQIPADNVNDSQYEEMVNNGHVICQLCHFLIGRMYQIEHYNEILGIVLFSLNENLSGAMSLLTNVNSALALYCKGNMYEFGGGVAVDLDQAIKNYEQSLKKEYSQRTEKRLAACQDKKSRYTYENDNNNYYQSDRSYHSTSTYTGSSTVDDGCFAPNTKILMADGSYCTVEKIRINDLVWAFDHYTGKLVNERIVANVHAISEIKDFDIIGLLFEDGTKLEIVKSHALFDISENRYVWINSENVGQYIGHCFASFFNGEIVSNKMVDYSIELKSTKYYMPISRYHLNIFAEGILAMPPTEITVNMFNFKDNMCYDLSVVQQYGLTPYSEINQIVSYEEYEDLPCKYLYAVSAANNASIKDFEYAIKLYREQYKYLE